MLFKGLNVSALKGVSGHKETENLTYMLLQDNLNPEENLVLGPYCPWLKGKEEYSVMASLH